MPIGSDKPAEGVPDGSPRAVQRTGHGEHLCSFHGSEREQARLASAFVTGALGAGDRALYVTEEPRSNAVASLLTEAGIDADRHLLSTQLVILDVAALTGRPGDVEPGKVLTRYRHEADRARAAGYPGLRVAVVMDGFAETLGSCATLTRWEHSIGPAVAEAGI